MDQLRTLASDIFATVRGTHSTATNAKLSARGINRDHIAALHNGLRIVLRQLAERLAAEQKLMGDFEGANDWQSLADNSPAEEPTPPQDVIEFADRLAVTPANERLWQSIPHLGPAAFTSRYAIWRFAVTCETAIADEMINLSTHVQSQDARDRALSLARQAYTKAAKYRVIRRVAFHTRRSKKHAIALPAHNRIQTASDLGHAAGAIEHWLSSLLKVHKDHVDGLQQPIAVTNELLDHADTLAQGKVPPRLKNALQRLRDQAEDLAQGAIPAHEAAYLTASEAERIFDYYDALFEAADEPSLFVQAQALSKGALTRLRYLRQACEHIAQNTA